MRYFTASGISPIRQRGGLGPGALSTLRLSFFAGEVLRWEDADVWQRAAPGSVVDNLYGPTELAIIVSVHRWSAERTPALAVTGVVPIGAVHGGHRHLLLGDDAEKSQTEGELCVAGLQATREYLAPGTTMAGSWSETAVAGTGPAEDVIDRTVLKPRAKELIGALKQGVLG
ncbi:AMP-binding protein [Streptomyces sp. NBC_01451]|uniref:AMP-binding protein n=1 Tax=Streptomyces sp. NBC_01451 TaxID=2903872 RepID=UPI002E34FD46|nr:AMP-binding protein [Streptomyces sp. NBC_01451]